MFLCHIIMVVQTANIRSCVNFLQFCETFRRAGFVLLSVVPPTWTGMSPSFGKRTQLRHIFVTMFSRSTTICCVQYWMRHGLLVKIAPGIRSLNSAVTQSGSAGLQLKSHESYGPSRNTWDPVANVNSGGRVRTGEWSPAEPLQVNIVNEHCRAGLGPITQNHFNYNYFEI